MFRTSVLVSTLAVVLILAGIGGVAAQETGPDAETAEAVAVAQQEEVVEVVVEDRSGNHLSDIEVVAEWDGGSNSDTTTSDGRVLLDVPANTDVEFTVNDTSGEFVRNDQPVTRTASEVDGNMTIEMAPRGQVELSVVDSDGLPVEDARLRLFQSPNNIVDVAFTGEDGTAVISGVEQRSYTVDILRAGFLTSEQTININESAVADTVEVERSRVNVDFTVLDDYFEEPQPLEGAQISIGEDRTITTEENGRTEGILRVNTEYDISVTLDGYQDVSETLTLGEEDESLTLTTQRVRSISINQLQNAIVVGQPTQVTITNAYGDPVEGVTVDLNSEEVGQTNAQGQVVFEIAQAGNNTITASYRGRAASTTLLGVDVNQGDGSDGTDGSDSTDGSDASDGSDGSDGDGEDSGTDDSDSTDGSDASDGSDGSDGDGEDSGTDGSDGSDGDGEDGGDSGNGEDADAIGPGFGLVAAVGALLAVALIAHRRL